MAPDGDYRTLTITKRIKPGVVGRCAIDNYRDGDPGHYHGRVLLSACRFHSMGDTYR